MKRLDGKRCLLVGAGSGIGRGVFDAFQAEGADLGVLEIDGDKCAALGAANRRAAVVCGDATDRDDVSRAVDATLDAFGGIDVLVNCVGLFDYYLGVAEIGDDVFDAAFDEAMNVNVRSHLLSVKASLDHLRTSKGSVILTLSTSSFSPGRGGVLYVASKFALRGAVLALADELAPDIRVNAVAPGGTVGTDLRGLRSLGLHERSLGNDPDRESSIRARSPLDVALDGTDHAHSYVFLASDESRGMSGRFLHPDGGANLLRSGRRSPTTQTQEPPHE